MRIYPYSISETHPDGGFTAEEIRAGAHWLRTDVTCEACGKQHSLAMAGSTDNGKCVACGGRTS